MQSTARASAVRSSPALSRQRTGAHRRSGSRGAVRCTAGFVGSPTNLILRCARSGFSRWASLRSSGQQLMLPPAAAAPLCSSSPAALGALQLLSQSLPPGRPTPHGDDAFLAGR